MGRKGRKHKVYQSKYFEKLPKENLGRVKRKCFVCKKFVIEHAGAKYCKKCLIKYRLRERQYEKKVKKVKVK